MKLRRSFYFLSASVLFWLLSSFPAAMSPDSIRTWTQVRTGHFNDWFTVSYELFVWLFSFGGHYIFFVALTQCLLVIYAIKSALRAFKPEITADIANYVAAIAFLLPPIGGMAVTIWKDVVFSALLVIGLSRLITLRSGSRRDLSSAIALLGIGGLFRHDGWATLLGAGILSAIFLIVRRDHERSRAKKICVAFLVSSFICATGGPLLVKITRSDPVPRWLMVSAFLADLEYVNAVDPSLLVEADKALLDKISSGDSLEGTKVCESVNGLVFRDGFNKELASDSSQLIIKMWLRNLKSPAANLMADVRTCRIKAFIPPPFSSPPKYIYTLDRDGIYSPGTASSGVNIPGLRAASSIWIAAWSFNSGLSAWPGLHFDLIFLFVFLFYRRGNFKGALHPLVFFTISRMVVLVLFGVAHDGRYVLSTYLFTFPLLVLFPFLENEKIRNRRNKFESEIQ